MDIFNFPTKGTCYLLIKHTVALVERYSRIDHGNATASSLLGADSSFINETRTSQIDLKSQKIRLE
jgi:hypothetical protein